MCFWTRAMFLFFWICDFLCQLRVFRGALSIDKREFSSQNGWFFVYKYTLPHVLDTSMEVFDRFFYWVKNWLRQWKSWISGDRVIGSTFLKHVYNNFLMIRKTWIIKKTKNWSFLVFSCANRPLSYRSTQSKAIIIIQSVKSVSFGIGMFWIRF